MFRFRPMKLSIVIPFLILLFCYACDFSQSPDNSKAREYYDIAETYEFASKWDSANLYYRKGLEVGIANYFYLDLATVAIKQGQMELARKLIDTASVDHQEEEVFYNNRGFVLIEIGDYQNAVTDFDESIRLNPDFPYSYNNLGLAYYHLGDIDKAKSMIQTSLLLNDRNPHAHRNMALCALAEEDTLLACKHLRRALKREDDFDSPMGDELAELYENHCRGKN